MRFADRPIPKLRRRADGRFNTRLNGRDFYFGTDEQTAQREYRALVAWWMAGGRQLPAQAVEAIAATPEPEGLLLGELIVRYLTFAKTFYVDADGQPTGQMHQIRAACAVLAELFAEKPAADFTPMELIVFRERLHLDRDLARVSLNHYGGVVKALYRWGVERGYVPAPTWQALLAVRGLQEGRTTARETDDVEPVSDEDVEATLPLLRPVVADMVRLQRLTGMRPGEVVRMTRGELDTSGKVWIYRPRRHKLSHRGKVRIVQLGPKSRAIVEPRLMTFDAGAPLFPSGPGRAYSVDSYRRAIQRAAKRAGVEKWNPNQLRHTCATELRREYGVEVAGAVLGHSRAQTTEVYAARDQRVAEDAVLRLG